MRHAHPHHPRGWEGHGGHHRGHRDHPGADRPSGPQTFRRGRALQFLEFLNVRRATLLRQLDQPEFADLRPTLLGELKAVESVRDEFMAMFDLWPDTEVTERSEPTLVAPANSPLDLENPDANDADTSHDHQTGAGHEDRDDAKEGGA
ncbi:hypothetical protein [Alicyclobacillus mali (ex Roth et al. 2021)]|uniref:hypothetical protein n=1 Tax=Alicyclobacillus mali (ex Roth et al. 2021) TaxID=1123961 RepID=UPI001A8C4C5D|nr:hypothetical protein [Alicyclobacillus mali (ex Roth et al. 2021)]